MFGRFMVPPINGLAGRQGEREDWWKIREIGSGSSSQPRV